jgi:hypothetical protein
MKRAVKFSVSKEVLRMIELLEKSPNVRRLLWALGMALACYPAATLVKAIRWW